MSRSLFRRVSRRVVRTRKRRVDGWVSLYCRRYRVGPHDQSANASDGDGDGERRDRR